MKFYGFIVYELNVIKHVFKVSKYFLNLIMFHCRKNIGCSKTLSMTTIFVIYSVPQSLCASMFTTSRCKVQ